MQFTYILFHSRSISSQPFKTMKRIGKAHYPRTQASDPPRTGANTRAWNPAPETLSWLAWGMAGDLGLLFSFPKSSG